MSRRIVPKLYAALTCYLALSPLYFLPACILLPGRLWVAALLPVPALVLTGIAGMQPAKRRGAAFASAIVLMAAICFALFIPLQPQGLVLYLPCAVTMLVFMPAMARPAHKEWSVQQLGYGVILHIVAQFLKGMAVFQSAAAVISWLFTLYLLVFLFAYNRSMIADTGTTTLKTMLVQNRKLLAGFCVLALLLTNIRSIGRAIRYAIAFVIQVTAEFMLWLTSLFQSEEAAVSSEGGVDFSALAQEATQPSMFARIMEIVFTVLAVLIALALLFFACKQLWKLLKKLYAMLAERLTLFKQRISADYDDSTESLLDWGEIKKAAACRLNQARQRLLPTPWHRLSPQQQVRRVYSLLLRKASKPDPSCTAREMLEAGALPLPDSAIPSAVSLYERARYSSKAVSQQEADNFRKQAGV